MITLAALHPIYKESIVDVLLLRYLILELETAYWCETLELMMGWNFGCDYTTFTFEL